MSTSSSEHFDSEISSTDSDEVDEVQEVLSAERFVKATQFEVVKNELDIRTVTIPEEPLADLSLPLESPTRGADLQKLRVDIAAKDPSLRTEMEIAVLQVWFQSGVFNFFHGFNNEEIGKLARSMSLKRYSPGSTIYEEGRRIAPHESAIFLLVEGSVVLHHSHGNKDIGAESAVQRIPATVSSPSKRSMPLPPPFSPASGTFSHVHQRGDSDSSSMDRRSSMFQTLNVHLQHLPLWQKISLFDTFGEADIYDTDRDDESFGLFPPLTRTGSACCSELGPCAVLALGLSTYRLLVSAEKAALWEQQFEFTAKHFLKKFPSGSLRWSKQQILNFSKALEIQKFTPHSKVYQQLDPSQYVYFVLEGEASVSVNPILAYPGICNPARDFMLSFFLPSSGVQATVKPVAPRPLEGNISPQSSSSVSVASGSFTSPHRPSSAPQPHAGHAGHGMSRSNSFFIGSQATPFASVDEGTAFRLSSPVANIEQFAFSPAAVAIHKEKNSRASPLLLTVDNNRDAAAETKKEQEKKAKKAQEKEEKKKKRKEQQAVARRKEREEVKKQRLEMIAQVIEGFDEENESFQENLHVQRMYVLLDKALKSSNEHSRYDPEAEAKKFKEGANLGSKVEGHGSKSPKPAPVLFETTEEQRMRVLPVANKNVHTLQLFDYYWGSVPTSQKLTGSRDGVKYLQFKVHFTRRDMKLRLRLFQDIAFQREAPCVMYVSTSPNPSCQERNWTATASWHRLESARLSQGATVTASTRLDGRNDSIRNSTITIDSADPAFQAGYYYIAVISSADAHATNEMQNVRRAQTESSKNKEFASAGTSPRARHLQHRRHPANTSIPHMQFHLIVDCENITSSFALKTFTSPKLLLAPPSFSSSPVSRCSTKVSPDQSLSQVSAPSSLLTTLTAGECFGFLSTFADIPASETITANTRLSVIRMTKNMFLHYINGIALKRFSASQEEIQRERIAHCVTSSAPTAVMYSSPCSASPISSLSHTTSHLFQSSRGNPFQENPSNSISLAGLEQELERAHHRPAHGGEVEQLVSEEIKRRIQKQLRLIKGGSVKETKNMKEMSDFFEDWFPEENKETTTVRAKNHRSKSYLYNMKHWPSNKPHEVKSQKMLEFVIHQQEMKDEMKQEEDEVLAITNRQNVVREVDLLGDSSEDSEDYMKDFILEDYNMNPQHIRSRLQQHEHEDDMDGEGDRGTGQTNSLFSDLDYVLEEARLDMEGDPVPSCMDETEAALFLTVGSGAFNTSAQRFTRVNNISNKSFGQHVGIASDGKSGEDDQKTEHDRAGLQEIVALAHDEAERGDGDARDKHEWLQRKKQEFEQIQREANKKACMQLSKYRAPEVDCIAAQVGMHNFDNPALAISNVSSAACRQAMIHGFRSKVSLRELDRLWQRQQKEAAEAESTIVKQTPASALSQEPFSVRHELISDELQLLVQANEARGRDEYTRLTRITRQMYKDNHEKRALNKVSLLAMAVNEDEENPGKAANRGVASPTPPVVCKIALLKEEARENAMQLIAHGGTERNQRLCNNAVSSHTPHQQTYVGLDPSRRGQARSVQALLNRPRAGVSSLARQGLISLHRNAAAINLYTEQQQRQEIDHLLQFLDPSLTKALQRPKGDPRPKPYTRAEGLKDNLLDMELKNIARCRAQQLLFSFSTAAVAGPSQASPSKDTEPSSSLSTSSDGFDFAALLQPKEAKQVGETHQKKAQQSKQQERSLRTPAPPTQMTGRPPSSSTRRLLSARQQPALATTQCKIKAISATEPFDRVAHAKQTDLTCSHRGKQTQNQRHCHFDGDGVVLPSARIKDPVIAPSTLRPYSFTSKRDTANWDLEQSRARRNCTRIESRRLMQQIID